MFRTLYSVLLHELPVLANGNVREETFSGLFRARRYDFSDVDLPYRTKAEVKTRKDKHNRDTKPTGKKFNPGKTRNNKGPLR